MIKMTMLLMMIIMTVFKIMHDLMITMRKVMRIMVCICHVLGTIQQWSGSILQPRNLLHCSSSAQDLTKGYQSLSYARYRSAVSH